MSGSRIKFTGDGSDALFLAGLAIVGGIGTWVWLTGQIAGLLFGLTWLDTGIADLPGIAFALPGTITDPAEAWPPAAQTHLPGPVGFAIAALLAAAATIAAVTGLWKVTARFSGGGLRGMASGAEIDKKLSAAAALRKAARLRPTLEGKATVEHVAVNLGKAAGVRKQVMADIENSVLILAAPRQGKTSQVIIPWLAHWQGPALVTTLRSDITLATYELRRGAGPVAVLDVSDTPWPDQLKWSPVIGCEDYDKARRRAKVLVTVGGTTGSDAKNSGFYRANAINLVAGWLHAAALSGSNMAQVVAWALDDTNETPIQILKEHTAAAEGVAANLSSLYGIADDTRTNLFGTVQTAIAPLLSARARRVFCPSPSEYFDIETFLQKSGTVYLLVPETQASELAPLISAFVDEVVEHATAIAATAPNGRLDPPLAMLLDEVANVVPLEHLPQLMSYAAGSGIFVVAILQEIAAARQRWGRDGADMLWGAATVKIALGGLAGDEAGWFADLAGKWWEHLPGVQYGPNGVSRAPRDRERDVITADQVRRLDPDKGEALIIAGATTPVKTRMERHYKSRDAPRYEASADHLRDQMTRGAAVTHTASNDAPRTW
jgi:type IV secretion system protein VirD4